MELVLAFAFFFVVGIAIVAFTHAADSNRDLRTTLGVLERTRDELDDRSEQLVETQAQLSEVQAELVETQSELDEANEQIDLWRQWASDVPPAPADCVELDLADQSSP